LISWLGPEIRSPPAIGPGPRAPARTDAGLDPTRDFVERGYKVKKTFREFHAFERMILPKI